MYFPEIITEVCLTPNSSQGFLCIITDRKFVRIISGCDMARVEIYFLLFKAFHVSTARVLHVNTARTILKPRPLPLSPAHSSYPTVSLPPCVCLRYFIFSPHEEQTNAGELAVWLAGRFSRALPSSLSPVFLRKRRRPRFWTLDRVAVRWRVDETCFCSPAAQLISFCSRLFSLM